MVCSQFATASIIKRLTGSGYGIICRKWRYSILVGRASDDNGSSHLLNPRGNCPMNPPTGTITFLFTDIEGSTKLWERCPDAMRLALARHDQLLREVIERHNGYVFKTMGDAFCAAFSTAAEALHAALEAQLWLLGEA